MTIARRFSLLIQFAGFSYFIGGDIEAPTETKIAALDQVMDVDVYQANHHAAEDASSDASPIAMRYLSSTLKNQSTTNR